MNALAERRLVCRSRTSVAIALFAGVLLAYLVSPIRFQTDSLWTIPTAISLWKEGDANLDEYTDALAVAPYGIETIGEHQYSFFPLSVSLVALPFVVAGDLSVRGWRSVSIALPPDLERMASDWEHASSARAELDPARFAWIEQGIASFCTAAAVALLFLASLELSSCGAALAAALCLAFGTSAYSSASRVLWQHGPGLLFLSIGIYAALRMRAHPLTALLMGVTVSIACALRPLHALSVPALFLLARTRPAVRWFVCGCALVALPFCMHAWLRYGELLPPYYHPWRLSGRGSDYASALWGQLFSPARGLFVYSPILLVALLFGWQRIARLCADRTVLVATCAACAYLAVVAGYPHWWGGHCYGPRLDVDGLPWFLLLLASALHAVRSTESQRAAKMICCALLAMLSVGLHLPGAWSIAASRWNLHPTNVDQAPQRLWDWRDPPFLR